MFEAESTRWQCASAFERARFRSRRLAFGTRPDRRAWDDFAVGVRAIALTLGSGSLFG
ncbi:protein of unknown function [Modestobacter italicus]|uniref:Uncharacterized protein n=1 Tax=Modestobacter italicus (strain DSM 44449 / CECT 9708 / BC 501) TaxID=2732864 RepID=I4ERZ8_MODI5|nr:protein of unknown function [Modestobacter marinus]